MDFLDDLLGDPITLGSLVVAALAVGFGFLFALTNFRLVLLGFKNLRRNLVRTLLAAFATVFFVFMVTMIWTILHGLDNITRERSRDLKLIVSERWQIPSQLPMTHAAYLDPESPSFLPELKGLYGKNDFMTWSFYGGTLDPAKRTPENIAFFFTMDPRHITTMMDELETLDPKLVEKMMDPRKPEAILVGGEKLAAMHQKVGSRFKLTSINYKDLDLEVEVVGELPDGRYSQSALLRVDYFLASFDKYTREKGKQHEMHNKRLNLIWIRVPDRATFDKVGSIIENADVFSERPLKVETASSGISSFLDAYRDLLNIFRYFVVPGMLMVMMLVMSIAISISVRERRGEMAVMKVLGYRPNQILQMVLSEALLVGGVSGLVTATATCLLFNLTWGGVPFRIGFFPVFRVPEQCILWGLAIGCLTAFVGSILPAWSARSVKVSEVFARVA